MKKIKLKTGGIRHYFLYLFFICLSIPPSVLKAQIRGTVFSDHNASGSRTTSNPNEQLIAGITATAYNSARTTLASYTTTSASAHNHNSDFGFMCTEPSAITLTKTLATCSNGSAQNNGTVKLVSATNATKWGISTLNAGTYDGNNYAAATNYAANTVVKNNIPNTGATYILRLFNGADDCYKDVTIVFYPLACAPCQKTVLYICGTNKPNDANAFDHGMIEYLRAIGHTVTAGQANFGNLVNAEMTSVSIDAISNFDKIVVSHSAYWPITNNWDFLRDSLVATTTNVLMLSSAGVIEMGLTNVEGGQNPASNIWIEDNTSPILPSGLSNGSLSIVNAPTAVGLDGYTKVILWGSSLGSGAIVGSYVTDQPDTRATYFGYPKGATMANGNPAPGRRFLFGTLMDGASIYQPQIDVNDPNNFFTADGKKMLDAALENTCLCITCTPPSVSSVFSQKATCTSNVANSDAAVAVRGITGMAKYAYRNNATDSLWANTATASNTDSIRISNIANPSVATTYTFRIWGSDTTCYNDTIVVLNPKTCVAPTLSYTESCKCFDVVYDLPDTDPLEFTDSIKVTSNAGEMWRFVSHSGLEVPDTLINIPLAQNAALFEFAPGMYGIRFSHTSGVGYTGQITNGISTLNISNLCTNPSLTIPNLAGTQICPTAAPFSLTTAVATLNGVQEPGTFTFNIVRGVGDTLKNVTVLDPSLITNGTTVQVIGRYMPTNTAYCPHTFVYNVTVTSAACPCGVTINSVTPSTCDPFLGATYSLSVNVHWENAPTGEAINITTTNGATASFTPSTPSGTQTVMITGLASNGVQNIGVTAQFATTTSCSATLSNAYNAPTNCSAAPCTGGAGSLGGHVYEDLNDNGSNNGELGLNGMIVKIYDCNNNLVTTTLTNANGEWSATGLTNGIKYRVEFSIPSSLSYLTPSVHGTNNGTTTQFATAPTCSIDLGLINPADYCQDNPLVIMPCYFSGQQNNNQPALVGVYYNQADSNTPTENGLVNDNNIGTTYGVAWQRNKKIIWASAMTRHFFDYGPSGFDAIYGISFSDPNGSDAPTPTASVAHTIDLSALGVNVGITPRTTSLTGNAPYNDGNVYQSVGKIGIGDIDISDDGDTLFVVNLNAAAPSLVRLNISNPASVTLISETPIPSPGCTGGAFAPWALKYHNGKVYIGGVCTAETSQNVANLSATVYRYDGSTTFTTVATMPLNYDRATATFRSNDTYSNADWRAWTNTWNPDILPLSPADLVSQPMPILQDIEFDDNGSMILGFGDRFAYMTAFGNRRPGVTTGTTYYSTVAAGDIIRFCNISGSLVREGTSGSCVQGNTDRGALEIPAIPDNIKEYYNDDYLNSATTQAGHSETMLGGLAKVRGKSELLAVTFDPRWNQGPVNTSGVRFLNNNGSASRGWVIVPESASDANRKGGSLGDIEILCNPAPFEIGNYVWLDSDKDGVQDPCETPLSNVTVTLWKGGTQIASTTTSSSGEYYFSSRYLLGAAWTGTGADTTLLPSMAYEVRIATNQAPLSMRELTTANATANNGNDQNDSDASISGGYAVISLTTDAAGSTNHTYDFGFHCIPPTITNVARDTAVCTNGVMASNAAVAVRGIAGMAKYAYSTNGTTGLFANIATASTLDSIRISNLANPSVATTYTFRIWGVDTTCYNDTTVILPPSVCPPCSITATFLQNSCNNNGTTVTGADDHFTVTISAVSATNGGTSGKYEVVLMPSGTVLNTGGTNYGSPITVGGSGIFSSNGSTTYQLKVRDLNIAGCETTVFTTTASASCSTIPCPPQICMPVTISRN
jgi:hypothetical protein